MLSDPFMLALTAGSALLAVVALGTVVWRMRQQPQRRVRRVIRQISNERLEQTLVPDGIDEQIYLEYLLLTPHGLLVIDVKYVEGVVFAGENMDEWAVLDGQRRRAFPNPLRPLSDRVSAVRAIATDVPVHGRVVFAPGANFPHTPPAGVASLDQLRKEFGRRDRGTEGAAVGSFYAQWKRLEAAARPATL